MPKPLIKTEAQDLEPTDADTRIQESLNAVMSVFGFTAKEDLAEVIIQRQSFLGPWASYRDEYLFRWRKETSKHKLGTLRPLDDLWHSVETEFQKHLAGEEGRRAPRLVEKTSKGFHNAVALFSLLLYRLRKHEAFKYELPKTNYERLYALVQHLRLEYEVGRGPLLDNIETALPRETSGRKVNGDGADDHLLSDTSQSSSQADVSDFKPNMADFENDSDGIELERHCPGKRVTSPKKQARRQPKKKKRESRRAFHGTGFDPNKSLEEQEGYGLYEGMFGRDRKVRPIKPIVIKVEQVEQGYSSGYEADDPARGQLHSLRTPTKSGKKGITQGTTSRNRAGSSLQTPRTGDRSTSISSCPSNAPIRNTSLAFPCTSPRMSVSKLQRSPAETYNLLELAETPEMYFAHEIVAQDGFTMEPSLSMFDNAGTTSRDRTSNAAAPSTTYPKAAKDPAQNEPSSTSVTGERYITPADRVMEPPSTPPPIERRENRSRDGLEYLFDDREQDTTPSTPTTVCRRNLEPPSTPPTVERRTPRPEPWLGWASTSRAPSRILPRSVVPELASSPSSQQLPTLFSPIRLDESRNNHSNPILLSPSLPTLFSPINLHRHSNRSPTKRPQPNLSPNYSALFPSPPPSPPKKAAKINKPDTWAPIFRTPLRLPEEVMREPEVEVTKPWGPILRTPDMVREPEMGAPIFRTPLVFSEVVREPQKKSPRKRYRSATPEGEEG